MSASWTRRLRWWLGRGWSAADFAARYASGGSDAWGYRDSPAHRQRAEAILAALPKARFANVLEVGCAQGFLSERLAARCDRLTACDLAEAAVEAARETCAAYPQAEFRRADIRNGFPGQDFDLCLFSDVLYYLSPREIDAVLAEAVRRVAPAGYLLIVNEWSGARGLTSPEYALRRLDESRPWARIAREQRQIGTTTLFLGLYQLREQPTPRETGAQGEP